MTWSEIDGSGDSHFIDVEKLSKKARDRLREIQQDDVDDVYSLRISGRRRVFGIRDRNVLRLLWWDPEHEVCPSKKKGT